VSTGPHSGFLVDVDHVARRAIQEAFGDQYAGQWLRRADVLEQARPRPGDFNGRASAEELAERDARLTADAERCRRHAALLLEGHASAYAADVRQVLGEVA
jgi:hypothetical protein